MGNHPLWDINEISMGVSPGFYEILWFLYGQNMGKIWKFHQEMGGK
jgi:hypothetical protein